MNTGLQIQYLMTLQECLAFLNLLNSNVCISYFLIAWILSFSLQFDPAPRRGEPHVTRRTPDYFL